METKKRKGAFYLVLAILLSLTLSGCGNKKSMKESSDYKDTKHMVIDILKTPEGKKALKQSIKGESGESGESGGSKEEGSSSESDGMKVQNKDIAKIVKQENKKQMKTMSSDPEFQKAIIAATKTPEFQNALRIEMVQIMAKMQEGLMKEEGGKKGKSEEQSGGDSGGSEEKGESGK